jgi:hypothetical protein
MFLEKLSGLAKELLRGCDDVHASYCLPSQVP